MWVVLVAVVAVVAGVVVAAVFRRPEGNDLSSVKKYHSALGTIEQLSDRIGQAPIGVVGPSGRPGPGAEHHGGQAATDGVEDRTGYTSADAVSMSPDPTGQVGTVEGADPWYPPSPGRADGESPVRGTPLVFDDSRLADHDRREGSPHGLPNPRADRARRHALESMNRRPRRGTAVVAVVAVVALVAALAFLGSRHPVPTNSRRASTTPASPARAAGSTSSTGSGSRATHRGSGTRHNRSHGTRTTPPVAPTQIVAAAIGPRTATYPVAATSYSVTVTATGPCWVQALGVPSGSTLWTGTLQAGASQVIQATGTITVELGAHTASMSVGTVPVVLPTPLDTPFVATFQPLAASPTGSTTPAT
jgi:hypothetical protein